LLVERFIGAREGGIIPLAVKWFVEDGVDDGVVEREESFYLHYRWSCEVTHKLEV